MSDYSESDGSLIDDLNPSFKATSAYPTKSPSKMEEKVKLVHSKLKDESVAAEGESEDSEYAEDEDL